MNDKKQPIYKKEDKVKFNSMNFTNPIKEKIENKGYIFNINKSKYFPYDFIYDIKGENEEVFICVPEKIISLISNEELIKEHKEIEEKQTIIKKDRSSIELKAYPSIPSFSLKEAKKVFSYIYNSNLERGVLLNADEYGIDLYEKEKAKFNIDDEVIFELETTPTKLNKMTGIYADNFKILTTLKGTVEEIKRVFIDNELTFVYTIESYFTRFHEVKENQIRI